MGHKVTVVTPNPLKDPSLTNLTEIDVSESYDIFKTLDVTHWSRQYSHPWQNTINFFNFFEGATKIQMENVEVQELLKKDRKSFDLIIIESQYPALFSLQGIFDAPLIGISSLGINNFYLGLQGNYMHPVLYPDILSELSPELGFLERCDSTMIAVGVNLLYKFYLIPQADIFSKKYFGNDIPYVEDLMKRTSLSFLNINSLLSLRTPYVPNVIEVALTHMNHAEALPKDLQDILDNAKKGAIYFSLGTNVRFGNIPQSFEDAVLKSLCELPFTVLLKWYKEDLPIKCKNVIVKKWYPQQSILAHPNIKAFVMQGGLQSLEEAIYYAIPMVVIPFLGDQPINAKKLTSFGLALQLNPVGIKQEELTSIILEVANNPRYKEKAVEAQKIFLDQPKSGLDQVLWWCEYVIRHKGAKHLRSPAADLPLYQYLLLDVIGDRKSVV